MAETISFSEYLRWQDFYVSEPFFSERVDIAGALVASTIANVNRGKNSKPASIDDFMVIANTIKRQYEEKEASDDSSHLKSFILSMGGKVK